MNAFFQELFQVGMYKRNQGRITRQVTLAAIALAVAAGFYRFSQTVIGWGPAIQWGAPLLLAPIFLWMAYRLINVPRFADFLIAVEAEMNKVSWPTRAELFRSSVVVLVCIVALAIVLAMYDAAWFSLFKRLGILGE